MTEKDHQSQHRRPLKTLTLGRQGQVVLHVSSASHDHRKFHDGCAKDHLSLATGSEYRESSLLVQGEVWDLVFRWVEVDI